MRIYLMKQRPRNIAFEEDARKLAPLNAALGGSNIMKRPVNIPVVSKSVVNVSHDELLQFEEDLDKCLLQRRMEHCYAPHVADPVVGWVQWTCDLSLPFELGDMPRSEPALYIVWALHAETHRFVEVALDGFRQLGWMAFSYSERDEAYWACPQEFANRVADLLRYGPSYNFFQTLPQNLVDALLAESQSQRDVSPRDFEILVCDIFNANGFSCHRTMNGLDKETGDVFVFSTEGLLPQKIVVEAKRYSRNHPVSLQCLKQLCLFCQMTTTPKGV